MIANQSPNTIRIASSGNSIHPSILHDVKSTKLLWPIERRRRIAIIIYTAWPRGDPEASKQHVSGDDDQWMISIARRQRTAISSHKERLFRGLASSQQKSSLFMTAEKKRKDSRISLSLSFIHFHPQNESVHPIYFPHKINIYFAPDSLCSSSIPPPPQQATAQPPPNRPPSKRKVAKNPAFPFRHTVQSFSLYMCMCVVYRHKSSSSSQSSANKKNGQNSIG